MSRSFNTALVCCTFVRTREWRNGRRAGLRIQCRKACGFKSRLSQPHKHQGFFPVSGVNSTNMRVSERPEYMERSAGTL